MRVWERERDTHRWRKGQRQRERRRVREGDRKREKKRERQREAQLADRSNSIRVDLYQTNRVDGYIQRVSDFELVMKIQTKRHRDILKNQNIL